MDIWLEINEHFTWKYNTLNEFYIFVDTENKSIE